MNDCAELAASEQLSMLANRKNYNQVCAKIVCNARRVGHTKGMSYKDDYKARFGSLFGGNYAKNAL